MLQVTLHMHTDQHVNATSEQLKVLVARGCKPNLRNTPEDRRFVPQKTIWNQDTQPISLSVLLETYQDAGNFIEAEATLKAALTGDPFYDLNINVQLLEMLQQRQAPFSDYVPFSQAVVHKDAEADSQTAFYSTMILASHYLIDGDLDAALKYAHIGAADEGVKGTPADGVARVFMKRVHLLRALENGTLAKHLRPASSIQRMAASTGGWTYDGKFPDPTINQGVVGDAIEIVDWISSEDALANVELFKEAYLKWNRPVVVGAGLLDEWRAKTAWTKAGLTSGDRSKLKTKAQQTPYAEMVNEDFVPTTIGEFVEQWMNPDHEVFKSKEQPYYIFQELPDPTTKTYNATAARILTEDFEVPLPVKAHHSWRESKDGRAAEVWLPLQHFFVGAKGSGSHLHAHVATFNALLYGRKHWYLVGPEYTMHDTYEEQRMPIQRFREVGLETFKEKGIKVIEFIQQAGEVVFVPHKWMHAVYNLEDSVGVSYQMGEGLAEDDRKVLGMPIVDMVASA